MQFEPWFPAFTRARAAVAAHAGADYASYREEELLYWMHLPGWIWTWAVNTDPQRVLDVGAGYGTLAAFVGEATHAKLYGVDIRPQNIAPDIARKYQMEIAGLNIELDDLPWPVEMDAIILTEVLEHFNFHPVPTLRKLRDHLGDHGRLFLSTPDAASWGRITKYYNDYQKMPEPATNLRSMHGHIYQFMEGELRQVLQEAGFRIERFDRAPGRWSMHFNVEASKSRPGG